MMRSTGSKINTINNEFRLNNLQGIVGRLQKERKQDISNKISTASKLKLLPLDKETHTRK